MNNKILLLLFSLLLFENGHSCDCKEKEAVKIAVANSALVIRGKILHVEYSKPLSQDQPYLDSLSKKMNRLYFGSQSVNEYVVLVERAYKGAANLDTLIIRTGIGSADCGLVLDIGAEMIFYGRVVEQGSHFYDVTHIPLFSTSSCSRTCSFSGKEEKAIQKALR
jgi:hypothetical protein